MAAAKVAAPAAAEYESVQKILRYRGALDT